MRLTSKGRYAVTAMLDVALHSHEGPVPLADISERQGISLSYLEQLFSRLRKNELVSSVRGPGGGYLLARGAGEIFIAQVISAVDESVDATRCQGTREGCQGGDRCLTHALWRDLSDRITDFLSSISLEELVNHKEVIDVADRQDDKRRAHNLAINETIINLQA
ncbi:Fe-S cluster assembly transcriptional regulator IscR [Morganella morganii subsp. morganii]|jgi:Rrf2 family iron-sulfur cluster assembly transcriptional regulator|uniref:Fe-S cluster assembly transcriptional regulator IscR n=1 Tax=Morganella morganii TaxID=582 RepID=A0AAN5MDF3_MORMO|nr:MULTISPECIES: Fe-S cluster assembly transcriptional regulator IscR [Morganella]EGT3608901.1 Fe-S cluster assembly transcriptional regulator IscR [Morganella morganii]ELA8473517.1 Fe-S cluster assembly transcriptional regulator IscR [Morganella morganii]ELA9087321.1 Fe-S cluster assembly transcriptional regulator IscR [Morganella morganii]ELA9131703.1 Fe-S cluster assembly transcriptional regulator IscR [Morganella morganii]MBA5852437.1 Fe-S cluster assembly transcriptional regulator IscR [M